MKCRSDSDKHAFFDGQTARYSALDSFFIFYRRRAAFLQMHLLRL